MSKIVFLDRDGILNESLIKDGRPFAPRSLDELRIVPAAAAQLRRLKARGYVLVVATNQPDVARRKLEASEVEKMHGRLRRELPIDEIETCFHDDADHCNCRKPEPGMLLAALQRHQASSSESFMIGDRWRDVEAGKRAGVRTVFLDACYAESARAKRADAIVTSLKEAVDWILAQP